METVKFSPSNALYLSHALGLMRTLPNNAMNSNSRNNIHLNKWIDQIVESVRKKKDSTRWCNGSKGSMFGHYNHHFHHFTICNRQSVEFIMFHLHALNNRFGNVHPMNIR